MSAMRCFIAASGVTRPVSIREISISRVPTSSASCRCVMPLSTRAAAIRLPATRRDRGQLLEPFCKINRRHRLECDVVNDEHGRRRGKRARTLDVRTGYAEGLELEDFARGRRRRGLIRRILGNGRSHQAGTECSQSKAGWAKGKIEQGFKIQFHEVFWVDCRVREGSRGRYSRRVKSGKVRWASFVAPRGEQRDP